MRVPIKISEHLGGMNQLKDLNGYYIRTKDFAVVHVNNLTDTIGPTEYDMQCMHDYLYLGEYALVGLDMKRVFWETKVEADEDGQTADRITWVRHWHASL